MNKKILIITIFVSNIAFGAVLLVDLPNTYIESKKANKLSEQIVENLYSRGIDLSVAKQKFSNSLQGNEYKNELIVKSILKEFPNITQKEVVAYMSDSVLIGRNIDLNSYDAIIGLVQRNLLSFNQDVYDKVEKIYKNNRYI